MGMAVAASSRVRFLKTLIWGDEEPKLKRVSGMGLLYTLAAWADFCPLGKGQGRGPECG
jgi:hypothetical protein